MKRILMMTAAMGAFCAALSPLPAKANNPSVEAALANYGDVSMFYAAMLNTGVLQELDPNKHYTIFAPTNEAFAQIKPSVYPCFYSTSCRSQVADMLRDHIVVGEETLDDLANEPDSTTLGHYRVYTEQPYKGTYTIGNNRVLSGAEIDGNMIYRIDGVILSADQLASFRSMPAPQVTEERTVTTYRVPASNPVPGGDFPATVNETVTEKTYMMPGSTTSVTSTPANDMSDGDSSTTTTVTRTITRP